MCQDIKEPNKEISFFDQVESVKSFSYLKDKLNARGGSRAGEPELGARELGFFEGGRAGAGVMKIFGRSSFHPIIEKM